MRAGVDLPIYSMKVEFSVPLQRNSAQTEG